MKTTEMVKFTTATKAKQVKLWIQEGRFDGVTLGSSLLDSLPILYVDCKDADSKEAFLEAVRPEIRYHRPCIDISFILQ